jgi:hypothetical protein
MQIELKDIKKGQEFFEFKNGKNLRMLALEDAHQVSTYRVGYVCKVLFKFAGSEEKLELFEPNTPTGEVKMQLFLTPQENKR